MKDRQEKNNKKPIKVCHLITDSGTGGAEKILFELVTRLDPDRFQTRVIVMKKPGTTAEEIEAAGVPVSSLQLPYRVNLIYGLRLVPAFARLVAELRRDRPDILHCWLFQANLAGRIAARLAGVPADTSSLRVVEEERLLQYPLDRLTGFLVTRYVAVAGAVADHYMKRLKIPARKISTIPNGVEAGRRESGQRNALKERLSLPEGAFVIGAAGRLHKQKGTDILIQAMHKVRQTCPEAMLLIAGEGPERDALEEAARSLPDGVIRFTGNVRQMEEFYELLDVFALPSRWEGMPNALLEAMAAGVPAVAARTGGVPEIIGEEEAGIMVPPGSPEALADAVICLLKSSGQREKMKMNAIKRSGLFSLDKMTESYESLYEELLKGRP